MRNCQVCATALTEQAVFCPNCGELVDSQAKGRQADPLEGMTLDQKYRLIKKVGEGGMAKIYKAEHIYLKEIRAIKLIKRPDHRKETQYGRFLREARLARQVSSQTANVVRIDDFGYDQKQGVYYYSMELLEGRSLREVLREPPYYLSIERTVKIASQVCSAMALAHREGMVHRDLKPDNIFLVQRGPESDFVKILDFGLAKLLSPEEPNFTEAGKVVGTPEYMSPEQCRGPTPEERMRGVSHVDGRSDVYSLGIVMYQCLVGRAPFALEGEPNPQNFLKLMSRQISEKPKPLQQIRKDIPEPLLEVIDTALRKSPSRRFQSMEEFQVELLQAFPLADLSPAPIHRSSGSLPILELGSVISSAKEKLDSHESISFDLQIDPELEY